MKLSARNSRSPRGQVDMPARPCLTRGAGPFLGLILLGALNGVAATPEAAAQPLVATEVPATAHEEPASPATTPSLAGLAALTLAGNKFEPGYVLGGRQLVLNGGGIRSKMIIKIYAMALYLPAPQHDAQAVLRADAPHSIQVVLLRDVEAERMAEGFGRAMLDMQPDAGKLALQARVATLSEAFHRHGDVHRGDVLKFEYQPGLGTRVSVGGQAICPDITGQDFNVAVKMLWLGEHVSDERLKQALLGL